MSINFTWDTAHSYSSANLSVGSKVVEKTGGSDQNWSARSLQSISSGVELIKMTFDNLTNADDLALGLCNASEVTSLAGCFPGQGGNNSIGLISDGSVYRNGASQGTPFGAFADGDTAEAEVDVSGATIRFRKNGGAWSSTFAISALGGGPYYVHGYCYTATNKYTLVDYSSGGGSSASVSTAMMMGV